MRLNDIELEVLVKNRPILEYPHQGLVFVEGRAGSEYEIEVRNVTAKRVEAVISVDGLSVIDGKQAGPLSTGYVIEAHKSLRIPGWMLNHQSAAKFAFADKADSYATQSGEARNNGVIGVMVFREKPPVYQPVYNYNYNTMATAIPGQPWQTGWRGLNINDIQIGTATSASSPFIATSMSMNATCDAAPTAGSASAQSLGTAFGEATTFATTTVGFQRGDHHCTLLMYYDERRGLKQRGIRIGRSSKPVQQSRPQAFPAMGCVPPPGWSL